MPGELKGRKNLICTFFFFLKLETLSYDHNGHQSWAYSSGKLKSSCMTEHKGHNARQTKTTLLPTGVLRVLFAKRWESHHTKEYSPEYSLLQKIGVPAPKMGVQDCKSAVSESSVKPIALLITYWKVLYLDLPQAKFQILASLCS